jgi:hypothetical protein
MFNLVIIYRIYNHDIIKLDFHFFFIRLILFILQFSHFRRTHKKPILFISLIKILLSVNPFDCGILLIQVCGQLDIFILSFTLFIIFIFINL